MLYYTYKAGEGMRNQLTVKKIENVKDKVILLIGNEDHDHHLVISNQCFEINVVNEGSIVNEDYVDKLKACDQFHQIMDGAFKLLKKRDYGTLELSSKLIKKYDNKNAVEMVVAELQRRNYLNDEKFLESFVLKRQAKGMGLTRVILELNELGFKNINEAVYKIGQHQEDENAYKVGEKYFKKNNKKPEDKLIVGLYTKLSTHGFDEPTIRKVFNKLNLRLDEYN